MEKEKLIIQIKKWLEEAAAYIRKNIRAEIEVTEKSGRTDLVTNMDEEIQGFLIDKIQKNYPKDRILGEEKGYSSIDSFTGRVWIIDPIDGTMNFVMEKENFCIMIGIYVDGKGELGFIYDVMNHQCYWGGVDLGVHCNDRLLKSPKMKSLSDGLMGMNAFMFGKNIHHAKEIGETSRGIRVTGCAGLELIAMLKGNHIGYLSNLYPWDYAAGIVLLNEFGFFYSNVSGEPLKFSGREYFLAATPVAYQEITSQYFNL